MSWLKRVGPVILEQSSELPYVVLENGVFLCANNLFYEKTDHSEYFIKLRVPKKDILRKSTNCCAFNKFPITIPFDSILQLDDTVADGRIIKNSGRIEAPKKILVAKADIIHEMDDQDFQSFVEIIDDYDKSFLLVYSEINLQDRLMTDMMKIVMHDNWYKTCVTIAHGACKNNLRKYCWTKTIPDISITLHGLANTEEAEEISNCFESLGITEKEMIWA